MSSEKSTQPTQWFGTGEIWGGIRGSCPRCEVLGRWPHNEEPCPRNVPHSSCQSNGKVQATTILGLVTRSSTSRSRESSVDLCILFFSRTLLRRQTNWHVIDAVAHKYAERCRTAHADHELERSARGGAWPAGGRSLPLTRPRDPAVGSGRRDGSGNYHPGHENECESQAGSALLVGRAPSYGVV
jgi:hypothetical protein